MPYSKIIVHVIWSTKNRQKIITKDFRTALIQHIKENCKAKDIYLSAINCTTDHIHILLYLHPDQKLSKAIQLIKGESSFWINKNKIIKEKFEWQSEYMAISVSESNLKRVRRYIENQEEHHRKKRFSEEVNDLLKKVEFTNV
jgi:REP-associated tyrosine transposase